MNDQGAAPEETLTAEQRADLTTLLAARLTRGNIEMFAVRVLGRAEAKVLAGNSPPIEELARSIVEAIHEAGRLQEGVTTLRLDAVSDGTLASALNHVLNGGSLSQLANWQAVVHNPEDPFFDQTFQQLFPKIQRTVCAVALGRTINEVRGTGFLIGSNLVITNYHVIAPYLRRTAQDGVERFSETESGEEIHFFFDYMAPPKPRLPLDEARPHYTTHVRAQRQGWLRAARRMLLAEGIYPNNEVFENQLDYAVLELERDVGRERTRVGGGFLRGWLPLPRDINYLAGRPIIVAQHPGGAHQLHDFGGFEQLDPSQTRAWYRVNTANGSSGGAAVDRACQLFALHNAEVRDQDRPQEPRVNQGVRIDRIAQDLDHCQLQLPAPPPDGDPTYWSLRDNISDPQPIIGRDTFRASVFKMTRPNGERILTVTGPLGSGRRFSIDLLQRLVGTNVAVAKFTALDLQTKKPDAFLLALLSQIGVRPPFERMPEEKPTEMESRWIIDLPGWLARVLAKDQLSRPASYPAWVTIDALSQDGEQLGWDKWAENLAELIAALTGSDVRGQTVDIPQLRWLVVGKNANQFPLGAAPKLVDDLEQQTEYQNEFVACLQVAWQSVHLGQTIPEEILRYMYDQRKIGQSDGGKPSRKDIAAAAREIFQGALAYARR